MKRKSMATLIGGLLSVCLIGVGFASWIIVQGDSKEVAGSVKVEEVKTKKMEITYEWVDGDSVFEFTGTAGSNTGWFRSDTDTPEDLTNTLRITVTNPEYLTNNTIGLDFVSSNQDSLAAVTTTKNYINAPVINNHTVDTSKIVAASADSPSKYTFDLEITFTWGSVFGEKNPYTYYNSDGKTAETHADVASEALTEFYSYMNGLSFTLTIRTE